MIEVEVDAARGRRVARMLVAMAAAVVAWLAAGAPPAVAQEPLDKALGRPATASSVENPRNGGACNVPACEPGLANDGQTTTRWSSEYTDDEYWQVDLGVPSLVDTVALTWELAYPERYEISTSLDSVSFTRVARPELDLSKAEVAALQVSRRLPQRTSFPVRTARYVRITSLKRASRFGMSIWDASVYGPPDVTPEPSASLVAPPAPVTPFTSAEPSPPARPSPPATSRPRAPLRPLTPAPTVRIKGVAGSRGVQIELFTVRAPRSARVVVRCTGPGCPPRSRLRSRRGGLQRFRALQRSLRVGAVIETFVTRRGTYGRYTRLVIRPNGEPRRITRCVLHGSRSPMRCPAT